MPGYATPLDVILDINTGEKAETDYRPVPATDRGNPTYSDHGLLGFYGPSEFEQFGQPADVKFFTGYGGELEDIKRGFMRPDIRQHPAYDLSNYKDRFDQPRISDVRPGDVEAVPADFEFRQRNRETKGFLTRPRIPRERG